MATSETAAGSSTPPTMRAWVRQYRGDYKSSLKLVNDLPTPPIPGPDSSDVLIRVAYVALEYSIVLLLGILPALPFTPPLIPELAVSGIVVAAGGKAPEALQRPGTLVAGMTDPLSMIIRGTGTLKEYTRLPEAQVALISEAGASASKHSALNLTTAVGLVSNGTTALALMRVANVQSGQRILINGASGSVGHLAVQLCRDRGAFVVGVASGANEELVRGCGANEFVDYKKHASLPDYLASTFGSQPFDSILDCVGSQALYENSPRYLRPDGPVLNIGALEAGFFQLVQWAINAWRPTWIGGVPRKYIMFSNPAKTSDVLTLFEMVKQGKLKVLLDSEWAMDDLMKAYERATSKRATGKVLVRIHGD